MPEEIEIKLWAKRGKMLINTYALPPEDPDYVYNQVLRQGVDPEEYGIPKPPQKKVCPHCGWPLLDEGSDERKAAPARCDHADDALALRKD